MSIQTYLENMVAKTHCPITFSGDVPVVLSRWLVRSVFDDGSRSRGLDPYLDTNARLLSFNELLLLPKEEIEANWRLYIADIVERFQEVNTPWKLFAREPNKYLYGLNTVYCHEERDMLINVIPFYPSPIRIWINGELTMTTNDHYVVNDHYFMCRFREGSNTVLLEMPLSLQVPITAQEFLVKIHPVSNLAGATKGLMDEDLLDYYRTTHTIVPDRVFHAPGEDLTLTVLPNYFDRCEKHVKISVYNVQNELLQAKWAPAPSMVTFDELGHAEGPLRISLEREEEAGSAGGSGAGAQQETVYVYYGDLQSSTAPMLERAASRADCDPAVLKTMEEMLGLPGKFTGMNQFVISSCYNAIFASLERFIRYVDSPDASAVRSHWEVFGGRYTIFEPKRTGDSLIAYTVHLPEGYDPASTYPMVIYLHEAQARSFPVDLPWLKRSPSPDAIIVSLIGIGRLNYVDDVNVIRAISQVIDAYPVDRNRVHLLGFCTGGQKTYRIAMQIPDTFASISGLVGDMRLHINEPEYEQIDNLHNMAVYGIANVEDWFFNSMRKLHFLKQLPHSKTWMIHGLMHNEVNGLLNSKALLAKLLDHKRVPYPQEVKLAPLEPGYNKSYWVKIERIRNLELHSQLTARRSSDNRIEIEADNIDTFSLLLSGTKMGMDAAVELDVNGAIRLLSLPPFCKLTVAVQEASFTASIAELTEARFDELYAAIGLDEEQMGMKQLYLKACTVVKPEAKNRSLRLLSNKLAYLLQSPIKDRYIYYKYEACEERDFDWEPETAPNNGNHVLILDARNKSEKRQKLLDALGITLDEEKIAYQDRMFTGAYFAFMKVRHPYDRDRLLLLVAYNSEEVETEMISFMNTWDTNPLFYNDAVIFAGSGYSSFREHSTFSAEGEGDHESSFVKEYC